MFPSTDTPPCSTFLLASERVFESPAFTKIDIISISSFVKSSSNKLTDGTFAKSLPPA